MDKLEIIHANQTSTCLDRIRNKGEVTTIEHVKVLQYFFYLLTNSRWNFLCESFLLFVF